MTTITPRTMGDTRRDAWCCRGAMMVVMLLATGCAGNTLDQVQRFQAAQQAFDKARTPDDFARTADLYQAVLDHGGYCGAVLYNQGNAWLKAGRPGEAVAAYRQAQRFLPRNANLDANLRSALGSNVDPYRSSFVETVLFWQNWLSYPEKFYAAAAAALLTFACGVAWLSVRWRPAMKRADLGRTCDYRRSGLFGRLRLVSLRLRYARRDRGTQHRGPPRRFDQPTAGLGRAVEGRDRIPPRRASRELADDSPRRQRRRLDSGEGGRDVLSWPLPRNAVGRRGRRPTANSSALLPAAIRPRFSPCGEDHRQRACLAGVLARRVCPEYPRRQHGEQVRQLNFAKCGLRAGRVGVV